MADLTTQLSQFLVLLQSGGPGGVLVAGGNGQLPIYSRTPALDAVFTGDGTAGSPAHAFTNEQASGFYRSALNTIALSIGGTKVCDWNAARLNLVQSLVFTADNTFDVGASGATRPRTGYFGTSVVVPTLNVTTAYQMSGAAFPTATVGPASPTGTTSTTLVMAGLAGAITTQTGRIILAMSGYLTDNTANDGTKAQLSYGTGAAPVNGAALTGTQVGPVVQYSASTLAAAASAPYGVVWVITGLTKNTAYWFDTAFAAITGGTAALGQASMAAYDIP